MRATQLTAACERRFYRARIGWIAEQREGTYLFCPSTSLRPTTCQTTSAPCSSLLSNEYKQRAEETRSKYNVPPPIYPSFCRSRFTAFLIPRDPPPYRATTLPPPPLGISLFPNPLPYFQPRPLPRSPSSSLVFPLCLFLSSFWPASLHCQNESLRRDLNSSLPAPFPDFSSVKSAPRRAQPAFLIEKPATIRKNKTVSHYRIKILS